MRAFTIFSTGKISSTSRHGRCLNTFALEWSRLFTRRRGPVSNPVVRILWHPRQAPTVRTANNSSCFSSAALRGMPTAGARNKHLHACKHVLHDDNTLSHACKYVLHADNTLLHACN